MKALVYENQLPTCLKINVNYLTIPLSAKCNMATLKFFLPTQVTRIENRKLPTKRQNKDVCNCLKDTFIL